MTTTLCDNCGAKAPAVPDIDTANQRSFLRVQFHYAPCGAICQNGCSNNAPSEELRARLLLRNEPTHSGPWEGPPETDGHYHGECPNGCFKMCCKPKGNICGSECQQCYPKD